MKKRKISDQQLRDIVCSRLTKGDAFRIPTFQQYTAEQQRVHTKLAAMNRASIFRAYPNHTYDLKP